MLYPYVLFPIIFVNGFLQNTLVIFFLFNQIIKVNHMAFLSLILKGGRMTINEKLTMIGKAKKMLPLCVLFFIQAYYTFLIPEELDKQHC